MPKIINLPVYEFDKDNNYHEVGTKDYRIDKMRPLQFLQVSKNIKELIDQINEEPQITSALSTILDDVEPGMDAAETMRTIGATFVKDAAGSVAILLEVVPEATLAIISNLSNIPVKQIQAQDYEKFFDILDASIETNDIGKIVERVKKSGKLLQNSLKFGQVAAEASK